MKLQELIERVGSDDPAERFYAIKEYFSDKPLEIERDRNKNLPAIYVETKDS